MIVQSIWLKSSPIAVITLPDSILYIYTNQEYKTVRTKLKPDINPCTFLVHTNLNVICNRCIVIDSFSQNSFISHSFAIKVSVEKGWTLAEASSNIRPRIARH